MAWDLGYREKPISYYFKIPKTTCNEGWVLIKNDADALEMVKLISKKTNQINVYIIGGGRRRKKEAEDDALRSADPNFENPLNRVAAVESQNMEHESNLFGTELNREKGIGGSSKRLNMVGADVNAYKGKVRHEEGSTVGDGVVNLDGVQQQTEGTFGGLSDLVFDLFTSECDVSIEGNDKIGQQPLMEEGMVYNGFYNGPTIEEVPVQTTPTCGPCVDKSRLIIEDHASTVKLTAEAAPKNMGKGVILSVSRARKNRKQKKEPRYNTRNKGSKKYEQEEDDDSSSDDSDFPLDNDYDLADGEDDQYFQENVSHPQNVEEFEDMGFKGDCSDDGVETDEEIGSFNGSETEEDEEGNPLLIPSWRGIKLKSWRRRVDLKNPTFVVGLCFPNVDQLKEAIREYELVNKRGTWFQKNNKNKIEVKCLWGCNFWLYASGIEELGPNTIVIKTLRPEHKCSQICTSHHLDYNRITKEVQQDLLVDEDWSRKGIQNHIQNKLELDVNV
ncbi:hypothetical protein ACLB2K_007669 [Fragaria x ananassa]